MISTFLHLNSSFVSNFITGTLAWKICFASVNIPEDSKGLGNGIDRLTHDVEHMEEHVIREITAFFHLQPEVDI